MKQEETSQEKIYRTTDFYLSVWFSMNSINLLRIEKDNPSRLVFVFEDDEKREKLFEEFWKQEQLREFISHMQTLKIKMYEDNPPMIFKKIMKRDDQQATQSEHKE